MRAERVRRELEFVPVIVTLESQEEVDSLFVISNDTRICNALPALDKMFKCLKPFTDDYVGLNIRLDRILN